MNQLHRVSVSSFIIHLEIPKWLLVIIWECSPMGRISLCTRALVFDASQTPATSLGCERNPG